MSGASDRLLATGTRLFAKLGFAGTSVRAISEEAGTNVNSISYHYGSKKGLYQAILGRLGGGQLASAKRILGSTPTDPQDFETRLLLFAEETLAAYKAEPDLLRICFAEFQQDFRNCDSAVVQKALSAPTEILVEFLGRARRKGLLRKGIDTSIVAGTLMERISNQVLYADSIEAIFGVSIHSEKYSRHWIRQLVELLLYGAARPSIE